MPWKLGKRDGEIVVIRERDNKVVGRHKSRKKAVAQLRALYAIEKARSFGGDRSAAGRYAAEQRWKGHIKEDAKGSGGGGGPKRTVEEKLKNGPLNLSFGRDANGLPKVGSFDELCARYGVKPSATKKADLKPLLDYFVAKYGKYGLEMVFPAVLQKKIRGDQVDALPIILAGAQALEDVLDNLDLEGIGEAVARAREADERIKPIEGSTPAPEGMSKRQNLPVVKFTMNQNPNGDFTWNGEGHDQLRLHAAAISESTINALWMLASAKNKGAGSEEEMVYQTSTLFTQQDDTTLGMSGENFRTAQMRRAYGTMVHEVGHFLDYRLGPKGEKVGDLYQRKTAREAAGTPTFDQSATGYGRSNPNESIAETFAAWFLFSQARFPKERGDAVTRVTQRVQQDNEKMAKPLLTRAEIIKQMVRSAIAVTPNNLPLNHPVTLFTVYPFLNKTDELRDAFAKARSFGGDRSEAGRYAANIRWQNEGTASAIADENQIVRTTAQKFKQGPMLENGLDAEGLPRMLTADEAKDAYGVFVTDFTAELKRRGINLSSNKGLTNLNDPKTRGIVQALADIGDQFGGILAGTGFKVSVADDPLTMAAGEVFADAKLMTINPMQIDRLMKAATGMVLRLFPTEVLAEGDEALQKIAYAVVVHEFGHLLDNLAAAKVPPSERRLYRPLPSVTEEAARKQGDHFRWASLSYIGAEGQKKFVSQIEDAPMGSANWAQQYSTWNPAEQHAEAFSMWWLFSGYRGKRAEIAEVKRSLKDRGSDRSVKASLEFLKAAVIADTPDQLIQMPVMRTWALMAVTDKPIEKARSFGGDRSAAGRYAAEMRWAGHQTQEIQSDAKGKRFTSAMDDDRFREKYGNERLNGDGDCFEAAAKLMLSQFADNPSARVCHGVPLGRGEIEGIRFDHGWVEVEEAVGTLPDGTEMREVMVYDYSNGGKIVIPRSLYYMLGNIAPEDVKRFTAQEAMDKMRETRFYGPWD